MNSGHALREQRNVSAVRRNFREGGDARGIPAASRAVTISVTVTVTNEDSTNESFRRVYRRREATEREMSSPRCRIPIRGIAARRLAT
jgi:hypothetical protein